MKTRNNNSGNYTSLNRFPAFERWLGPTKQTPPPPKLKREACPTGKAAFPNKTEADARAALLRGQSQARPEVHSYYCSLCSRWHTTSKKRQY
jgi:hypothetical protein